MAEETRTNNIGEWNMNSEPSIFKTTFLLPVEEKDNILVPPDGYRFAYTEAPYGTILRTIERIDKDNADDADNN